jgi:hypothetical protein
MTSSNRPVFLAVPFDASSDADKPLLELAPATGDSVVSTPALTGPLFGKFKLSALMLGLLVGFFIQFSTLGANFLVITLWGEDVISKSKSDIVVFSLLWSFFTSAMAIVILSFLRTLVTITYNAVSAQSEDLLEVSSNRSPTVADGVQAKANSLTRIVSDLQEMVLHMECRFVVGALVGVCLAWTMTDIVLGMRAQILYSLLTLLVALFWCRVMMHCFSSKASKDISASDEIITV